jgi:hypothetical protein
MLKYIGATKPPESNSSVKGAQPLQQHAPKETLIYKVLAGIAKGDVRAKGGQLVVPYSFVCE